MLDPLLTTRAIFILGIINLVTGTAIFFSCRCLPGTGWGKRLMSFQIYQRFFKYHCYLWWIFWPSVVVHAVLALLLFGWPA